MGSQQDPKVVAQILTLKGFLRWAVGEPLRARDFKKSAVPRG